MARISQHLFLSRDTSVNKVYPELAAMIGPRLPDDRGLFKRGYGGKSGPLGQVQEQGVYVVKGTFLHQGVTEVQAYLGNACFGGYEGQGLLPCSASTAVKYTVMLPQGSYTETFDIDTGSGETRPENKAVRYLMRALR